MLEQSKVFFLKLSHMFVYQELTSGSLESCVSSPLFCYFNLSCTSCFLIHHHCCFFAVQLLQKLSISAAGKREKLMRVIKNPVTGHLPPNCRKIGKRKVYSFLPHLVILYCIRMRAKKNGLFFYQASRIALKSWSICRSTYQPSVMRPTLFLWLVMISKHFSLSLSSAQKSKLICLVR